MVTSVDLGLLKKLSEEEDEKAKEMAKRGDSTTMELADVYKGKDEEEDGGGSSSSIIARSENPMHGAAAMDLVAELSGQVAALQEQLRRHGILEDGVDQDAPAEEEEEHACEEL